MADRIKRPISFAKDIILHPRTATKEEATLKDLIIYLSIISLIPAAILTLIFYLFPVLMPISLMSILVFPISIIFTVIGFLILAGVIHFFGKIFRIFKKDYTHTFAGFVYGATPIFFLSWISLLSLILFAISFAFVLIAVVIIGLILAIWSFVLQIIALADQQSISKIKSFGVLLLTGIIFIVLIFFSFSLKPKLPPHPVGTVIFTDDYENNPTITKTTEELWMQIIEDTKKGNYWSDASHFLENAKSIGKRYWVDPEIGNAIITSDVSHSGNKSVEITVSEVPSGYTYVSTILARYFRNQSLYRDGVYEYGAWFYVPEGNSPLIVVGMENHPSFLKQIFAYAGLKTEDGSIYWVDNNEMIIIGNVSFQHNTWFKMWIVWDIRKERFTLYYKSPAEEKSFDVDDVWVSSLNLAYVGYTAYNWYAGAGNIYKNEQKVYVDDYYAKVIG